MDLSNKVAIVTGGADGIGAGITRAFIEHGAKVLFADVQEEKGFALAEALGANAVFLREDLRSPDMEQRILAAATAAFGGRIDILVNNAQGSRPALLLDVEQAFIDLTFESGLWATWKLMRVCHDALAASRGSIINFASAAGIEGLPTHGVYGMNKEAIRGLTRTAANEWGAEGIRVNVVSPIAETDNSRRWNKDNPEGQGHLKATVPLGRVGDIATDIAPVIVFLASDASQYMTGQTLMVDGGSTMLR